MDDLFLVIAIASAILGYLSLKSYYNAPPAVKGPVPGTETWTVEEVDALRQGSVEVSGPGKFRRQVSVIATLRPGPDGPVTTRAGGVECVYWRTETTRYYNELDDGKVVGRSEPAGRNWSRKPFRIEDATGSITVWPDGADVSGTKAVHREVERFTPDAPESAWSKFTDQDSTTAIATVEYAFRAGDRVLVHGEVRDREDDDGLVITKSATGAPFVITTKQERVVRERAEASNRAVAALRVRGYALILLAVACVVGFYAV